MIHVEGVFTPGSAETPFKEGFIQARNFLIYRMLSDNSQRRNELRHIRVEDVDYARKRVQVRVSKTRPRKLAISQKTTDLYREFVRDYWSKIPVKKRAHGYLFITRSGNQMSTSAINLIFETGLPQTVWLKVKIVSCAFRFKSSWFSQTSEAPCYCHQHSCT